MGSMGSQHSNGCSGACIDTDAMFMSGNIMVPLYRWPLGQWELGMVDPAENLRTMMGGADEGQARSSD